jgi:hypothetical protein
MHFRLGGLDVPRNVTSRQSVWGAVALLVLAAWLFWQSPLAVPPGMEMDELIEGQIAEQILDGHWQPFYPEGQGREALYHYWLAGWLEVLGRHVFTLRFASATLTFLGLALSYTLLRRLFGPAVALIALAVATTCFWLLFAARSGLRSTSLPPVAILAGYLFWRGLPLARPSAGERNVRALPLLLGAGLCLGLAFYTYTAARVLPAVFGVFGLYLWVWHRPAMSGRWRGLFLAGLVATAVAAPLYLYLRTHPEADQFDFLDFDRPLAALEQGDPQPALESGLATLGGFFVRGDPLMFDNIPGRPIFGPLTGLLFVVGLGVAVVRWRRPAFAFVLIWLGVSLIPGMLSQPAPNLYRLVGAQAVAFVFPALAVVEGGRALRQQTERGRLPAWSTGALTAAAILVIILYGVRNVRAYFTQWPEVEGVRFFWQSGLADAARYLEQASAAEPVALCTVLTYEEDPWWQPAWRSMRYLLQRTDLNIRYYDCRSTLVIPSNGGNSGDAGQTLYLFADGGDPSSLIPPEFQGGWLETAEWLPLGPDAGSSAALLSGPLPEMALPAEVTVEWAPEAGGGAGRLPARFGDHLLLHGYQRLPADPRPGEFVRLVTHWEVLDTPPPRLVLFTHLLSDPGTVVAQQDSLPLTSQSLRAGDHFWVLHDQIAVPADGAGRQFLLSIGLYSRDTMQRLPVRSGDQERGDRLFLTPLEVQAP